MQLHGQHQAIVRNMETFDFKDKLWIILELMDCGALSGIIKEHHGLYDEDFIRMVMLRLI